MDLLCVPSIVNSIELKEPFPTVTERYYTERYCMDVNNLPNEDHLILFHSNRACLITLAPSHPVFKNNIKKINFQVGKVDRLQNKVTGKGKKGGQYLHEHSVLCSIECEDGKVYNVISCIQGKLIEVNENLIENPKLFFNYPKSEGYLAIALPNIKKLDDWKNKFLDPEQYKEKLLSKTPLTVL